MPPLAVLCRESRNGYGEVGGDYCGPPGTASLSSTKQGELKCHIAKTHDNRTTLPDAIGRPHRRFSRIFVFVFSHDCLGLIAEIGLNLNFSSAKSRMLMACRGGVKIEVTTLDHLNKGGPHIIAPCYRRTVVSPCVSSIAHQSVFTAQRTAESSLGF